MANWHVFNTNRKASMQATFFILIVLIISVIIGLLFPHFNNRNYVKKKQSDNTRIINSSFHLNDILDSSDVRVIEQKDNNRRRKDDK